MISLIFQDTQIIPTALIGKYKKLLMDEKKIKN
jgi:hypothetical protein